MSDPPKTNIFVVVGDDSNLISGHLQSLYETTVNTTSDIDFRLDTKYYTVKVNLKSFLDLRALAIWRSSHREAVVTAFCYCVKRTQTTIDLTKLTALLQFFDFDCKIVACYQSSLVQPFATNLTTWANSYGFEIVDLDPDAADVSYYEEIHEKYGLARVDEILHSATWVNQTAKPKVVPKPTYVEDSDQFDPFDGELDDEDRKAIDSLFKSINILDYYGLRNTAGPEGEMSLLEEEEKQAKKRQKNKKKRQKKDIDQGQESEDVGIELDHAGETAKESVTPEEPKELVNTEADVAAEGDAKKKKKKPKKKKSTTEEFKPTSGAVYIDMSHIPPESVTVLKDDETPAAVDEKESPDAQKDAEPVTPTVVEDSKDSSPVEKSEKDMEDEFDKLSDAFYSNMPSNFTMNPTLPEITPFDGTKTAAETLDRGVKPDAKKADSPDEPTTSSTTSKPPTPESFTCDNGQAIDVDSVFNSVLGESFRTTLEQLKKAVEAQPNEKKIAIAGKIAEETFRQLTQPKDP